MKHTATAKNSDRKTKDTLLFAILFDKWIQLKGSVKACARGHERQRLGGKITKNKHSTVQCNLI